jgi:hypothetical protein
MDHDNVTPIVQFLDSHVHTHSGLATVTWWKMPLCYDKSTSHSFRTSACSTTQAWPAGQPNGVQ